MTIQDRYGGDPDKDENSENETSVGYAWMESDGTVFLNLFSYNEGLSTNMQLTYRVSDSGYEKILLHLGGIEEGEIKNVPAWPLTDEGERGSRVL